jgi:hypothetical protein
MNNIKKFNENWLKSLFKKKPDKSDVLKSEYERFKCQDCGDLEYKMYMINDDIWKKYGNKENTLCIECFEKRIGRKLTKKDFLDYKNTLANKNNPYIYKLINNK